MKFKVDDEEVFSLTETQKKVLKHLIHEDEFENDMKRRVHWIISHKLDKVMQRLKDEWTPKLKENGVRSIPLDDDEFAELVFSQPGYRNRTDDDRDHEKRKAEARKERRKLIKNVQ